MHKTHLLFAGMISALSTHAAEQVRLQSEASMLTSAPSSYQGERGAHVSKQTWLFETPPKNVPSYFMVDGPLLGNGDVGVVLAGLPEAQQFHISKNDFWRRNDPSVMAVGSVRLEIAALAGASYRQEQDMARAEVRGTFQKDQLTVRTCSWVASDENLLVTSVRCEGNAPITVAVRQVVGPEGGLNSHLTDNGLPVSVGRGMPHRRPSYFAGYIEDLRIEPRALKAEAIGELVKERRIGQEPKLFDGSTTFQELPMQRMDQALTVAAWIKIERPSSDAHTIVNKGRAYTLDLSNGRIRWVIGNSSIQNEKRLPLNRWIHVAGVFESQRGMHLYVDGELVAGSSLAPAGTVVPERATSSFSRCADNMPGSREVAVATRIIGKEIVAQPGGRMQFNVSPGETVYIVTVLRSDLDIPRFKDVVEKRTAELNRSMIDVVASQHLAWWSKFWAQSFIEIPDKEIERRWYAALYMMGSCSRAGKIAPGLWGNWITTDSPAWHGDYHLNYNFQAPYYIVYGSNHPDLSLPFYPAIADALPNGRAMAQRHGWKGVHLPIVAGPWGLFPENPDKDWGQRSNAAFVALNFIWYYQYTQDLEFMRKTAYPFLREVAEFWEDYLKFEDGRYVIYNDSIQEGSGPDMNSLLSLGLVRTLFKNIRSMSLDLGEDAARREKWHHIEEHLSAYPLQERDGKTVFRYSEKGTAWWNSCTLGIHHIFPAGAIGLDSDPKLLEICRNTITVMGRWIDGNGFSSWYTACARVGYDPKVILAKLRATCDTQPSNPILRYGGGGIENGSGFLVINEMLMQSHEGVVRFFPCWPLELDARFGDLRTVGAFLVSAELKNGTIGGVTIRSEKGRDCTVQNPWPGQKIRLRRGSQSAEILSGERITFKTTAGETITLGVHR